MIGPIVLSHARALVGVRWRHMGRDENGLDCIGLVLVAAARAGVSLPNPGKYAREPSGDDLRRAIAAHLDPVALPAVRDGDVLLFASGRWGGHVGIASTHPVYGVSSVIHAFLPRAGVVEEVRGAQYGRDPVAAFRWREG